MMLIIYIYLVILAGIYQVIQTVLIYVSIIIVLINVITGNTYIPGDLYRSGISLTSLLSNLAPLNNPIFGGSNLSFLTTLNGGWNIAYSSSSFGISLNNVTQALSINNTGLITIPQGISGYSTTNQVNILIANALTNYTTSSNVVSNYVSNTSLSNTISSLNSVNISNASWCRYQAINNSTAISTPASTSLLVLNCTYTGDVTINFIKQFQIIVKVVYQKI